MAQGIFISHSSKDLKTARTICAALEHRGLACWIAERDVGGGENYQEAIVHAIRAARVMVLVFTANANTSDEIKKELSLASKYGLTVIPVRTEDVVPSDAFELEFATRQWIDLFAGWEEQIERLANNIRRVLPSRTSEPAAGATSTAPPAPSPRPAPPGLTLRHHPDFLSRIGLALAAVNAVKLLLWVIGASTYDIVEDVDPEFIVTHIDLGAILLLVAGGLLLVRGNARPVRTLAVVAAAAYPVLNALHLRVLTSCVETFCLSYAGAGFGDGAAGLAAFALTLVNLALCVAIAAAVLNRKPEPA